MQQRFHSLDCRLYRCPIMNMDMSNSLIHCVWHYQIAQLLVSRRMFVRQIQFVIMPVQQSIVLHICQQIAIGIKIVATLINLYHRIKQLVDTSHLRRHCWYHRHTYHRTQRLIVEPIALCLQLVIHIQRYHHAHVHVNQLRR